MTRSTIIMLSARGEEYDKIHGFELGSDDYVVKPFSPKELMMRVGAVIKRSGKNGDSTQKDVFTDSTQKDVFTYQGLEVDFSARTVSVDGSRVEMTPKEYDLFFYMVRNKGIALTRESLISEVWGYDFFGDERTLDTHIKLLRLRLLRRRAHARYAYQAVAKKSRSVQPLHRHAEGSGLSL